MFETQNMYLKFPSQYSGGNSQANLIELISFHYFEWFLPIFEGKIELVNIKGSTCMCKQNDKIFLVYPEVHFTVH